MSKCSKIREAWASGDRRSMTGVRIAERGKPGTPQAKTWISFDPGYEVYDAPDLSEIVVGRTDPRIQ